MSLLANCSIVHSMKYINDVVPFYKNRGNSESPFYFAWSNFETVNVHAMLVKMTLLIKHLIHTAYLPPPTHMICACTYLEGA